ncbi:unnamed protein product [Allacma fusca]|uniref:Uncharacterized protein n=1 Tax=Allacma fusca TaxID=39272 RepID=A0A8J2L9X5_9HEXA|nr:unnamed protein product [Allacma fusca]
MIVHCAAFDPYIKTLKLKDMDEIKMTKILQIIVCLVTTVPLLQAIKCHECISHRSVLADAQTCNCMNTPEIDCEVSPELLKSMADYKKDLNLFRVDDKGHLIRDVSLDGFDFVQEKYDHCLLVVAKSRKPDEAALIGRIGLLSTDPGVQEFLKTFPPEDKCNLKSSPSPGNEAGLEIIKICVCKEENCNNLDAAENEKQIQLSQKANENSPAINDDSSGNQESVQDHLLFLALAPFIRIGMEII